MQVVIDRLEGNFAVAETESGELVNIPACLVPNAKEGDVVTICVDTDATEKRRAKIQSLQNRLFED